MLPFLEAQDSIISTGGGALNSNKYESKNNFNFFGSMSLKLYYRSEFQSSLTICGENNGCHSRMYILNGRFRETGD